MKTMPCFRCEELLEPQKCFHYGVQAVSLSASRVLAVLEFGSTLRALVSQTAQVLHLSGDESLFFGWLKSCELG